MSRSPQAQTQDVAFAALSLDGGGIRGLSSLIILREVMRQITGNITTPIYPWKYFRIICGTSTGGLIALMLGRLRMSIDDAIEAYLRLGREIFEPTKWFWKEGRYKASILETATQRIVGEAQTENTRNGQPAAETRGGLMHRFVPRFFDQAARAQKKADEANRKTGENIMLMDDRENTCKTFVCSTNPDNLSRPVHFRSYPVTANQVEDCKIWEAARATSAAPYFFKPAEITERSKLKIKYVDGGLRCNNPTMRLIREMRKLGYSGERVCILSIGTGHGRTINIPKVGGIPKLQLVGVSKALRKIATDCEAVEADVAEDFMEGTRPGDVYVRLNVEQGMQGTGLQEWKKYGKIKAHTVKYLEDAGTQVKINTLKRYIQIRPGCE